jgi:hypothetical protein
MGGVPASRAPPQRLTGSPFRRIAASTSTPFSLNSACAASTSSTVHASRVSIPGGVSSVAFMSAIDVCAPGGTTSIHRSPCAYSKSTRVSNPSTST